MSVSEVTAQLYVFLLAGFDTSASTMAFFLYELAKKPHIQEKVYESIKGVQDKYNDVTYDGVQELQYLEQCLEGKLNTIFDILVLPNNSPLIRRNIENVSHFAISGKEMYKGFCFTRH